MPNIEHTLLLNFAQLRLKEMAITELLITQLWVYYTQFLNFDAQIKNPCIILMHTYFQRDQDSQQSFSTSTKPDQQGLEHKILLA